MGRQIAVVLSPEDEIVFLSFLNAHYNIALFQSFAETQELLWIQEFSVNEGHEVYYIWNKDFPWEPQYKQTIYGSYYVSNTGDAPVLQYCRSDISRKNTTAGYTGRSILRY